MCFVCFVYKMYICALENDKMSEFAEMLVKQAKCEMNKLCRYLHCLRHSDPNENKKTTKKKPHCPD